MSSVMAAGRITMKSLAKFGFCLTILLTSVAGKWLISKLVYAKWVKCASHKLSGSVHVTACPCNLSDPPLPSGSLGLDQTLTRCPSIPLLSVSSISSSAGAHHTQIEQRVPPPGSLFNHSVYKGLEKHCQTYRSPRLPSCAPCSRLWAEARLLGDLERDKIVAGLHRDGGAVHAGLQGWNVWEDREGILQDG